MKTQKTTLAVAISAAIGITALVPCASSAAQLVPNGEYRLVINATPIVHTTSGTTFYKVGKDGAWNSSFTFGGSAPSGSSQGMTDNGIAISTNGGTRGSSVAGDGYAGSLVIDVTGNTFTTKSFNVDAILGTAGGTFSEYTDASKSSGPDTTGTGAMTGTIGDSGTMTFTPTGREGAVSGFTSLYDERWNVVPTNTSTYQSFSTTSASTSTTTIHGAPVTAAGDLNGDGVPDFRAILVSGGAVGSDWGGFEGDGYFEAWNVDLLSGVRANAVAATVTSGVAGKVDVLNSDTAPTGTTATVTAGSASHGTVTVINSGPFTLSSCKPSCAAPIKYQSTSGYTGPDSFTYTLTGSHGTTSTGTVNLTVASAGTAVANQYSSTTAQGTSVLLDVLSKDTDSNGKSPPASPVTLNVPGTSNKGGILTVVTPSNQISYKPPASFAGTDSFTYTFTDSAGKTSKPATVTVTVKAAPQGGAGVSKITPKIGTSVLVTTQQLVSASIPRDPDVIQQCVGGCFDFKATLSTPGGQAVVAMPPLTTPIPSGASFRKYIKGKWQPFVTNNDNSYASAPGSATVCPPPSATSYQKGLTVGDYCVRLTIIDGGPNDDDGSANGVITDPSGIATGTVTSTGPVTTNFQGLGSGGCALDGRTTSPLTGGSWWLIGTVIGWMGLRRRSSRQR